MKIPKNPEIFSLIPGSKTLENPVPKNPGIPGFGKIPSRKIPGLKFLIPLGPGGGWTASAAYYTCLGDTIEFFVTLDSSNFQSSGAFTVEQFLICLFSLHMYVAINRS